MHRYTLTHVTVFRSLVCAALVFCILYFVFCILYLYLYSWSGCAAGEGVSVQFTGCSGGEFELLPDWLSASPATSQTYTNIPALLADNHLIHIRAL